MLPEVKLMFAVLTNAIECLQKYSGAKTRSYMKQFKEAEEWIFNKDNRGIYSINHVCEVLDLDPSYLRKGLKRWINGQPNGPTTGPRRRIREPLRLQRRLRETSISL
jgi:transposase-like protein